MSYITYYVNERSIYVGRSVLSRDILETHTGPVICEKRTVADISAFQLTRIDVVESVVWLVVR